MRQPTINVIEHFDVTLNPSATNARSLVAGAKAIERVGRRGKKVRFLLFFLAFFFIIVISRLDAVNRLYNVRALAVLLLSRRPLPTILLRSLLRLLYRSVTLRLCRRCLLRASLATLGVDQNVAQTRGEGLVGLDRRWSPLQTVQTVPGDVAAAVRPIRLLGRPELLRVRGAYQVWPTRRLAHT